MRKSSELIEDKERRQYHIGVAPSEIAKNILLCGDPKRAEKVAKKFDKINHKLENREYITYTGIYKDLELSVMSTGIGADNTEIAVVEISNIVKDPILIRIGSCGALQPEIELGDLVISTSAVRLENTSSFYAPLSYPAVSNHIVLNALISSAKKQGYRYHVGITATSSSFYCGQGREVKGYPIRYKNLEKKLRELKVLNMEMETSCLFVLSALRGIMAGSVCAVYADRARRKFIDLKEKDKAEERCINVGIEAFFELKT